MFFIQDDAGLWDDIPYARPLEGGFLDVLITGLANNEIIAVLIATPLIASTVGFIWTTFIILAYLASIVLLVLYAYASVEYTQYSALQTQMLRDAEKMYDEHFRGIRKNTRLEDVFNHASSENPNDWKLAIIEADIILDDILKQRGYAGTSLGERLRSITPRQLASIDDAWEAHKVRNNIAHGGADFILTKRLAEETLHRYRRVFTEFDIM